MTELNAADHRLQNEISDRMRAEEELRQHTKLLSTLLDVSNLVSSSMELKPLLEDILDRLKTILDYDSARFFIVSGEKVSVFADRSYLAGTEDEDYKAPMASVPMVQRIVLEKKPVVIGNIHGGDPMAVFFWSTLDKYMAAGLKDTCSWMGLPMIVKDRVVGVLSLEHSKTDFYRHKDIEIGTAFANQAAIEFENARLYREEKARAEEMAVAAERNRLARDLHDAVTQTLFSASLIAEVLPRLWEKNPEDGRSRLEELRQLTRGALAEMRTLLFELRPATLVEAALEDLLRQLTEAITGRARIPVALKIEGRGKLATEVKIALYRIAQEALNNIAKHSAASAAEVLLKYEEGCGGVRLKISDDGKGFEPRKVTSEHLGVGIMRERAEAIGAELRVESRLGSGTDIILYCGGCAE